MTEVHSTLRYDDIYRKQLSAKQPVVVFKATQQNMIKIRSTFGTTASSNDVTTNNSHCNSVIFIAIKHGKKRSDVVSEFSLAQNWTNDIDVASKTTVLTCNVYVTKILFL